MTSISPTGQPHPAGPDPIPPQDFSERSWFAGPNGIRAGWRLLMFLTILIGLFVILQFGMRLAMGRHNASRIGHAVVLTPGFVAAGEAASFIVLCIAVVIMARFEHRRFSDYGLPWRPAFPKNFWAGALWGFLSISAVIFAIFALHGFQLLGISTHGAALEVSALEWAGVFLLVGLFEEFLLRGYAQFTLTTGIGFWPSALILSAVFAALHSRNGGESRFGLVAVGLFGLFACLALQRTGSLWWPIGFHAAWDWGQTFFYGVPDSGLPGSHAFWSSQFHGPQWLTGGTVGPEASIFTPIVLLLAAILVAYFYPQVQYPRSEALLPVTDSAA